MIHRYSLQVLPSLKWIDVVDPTGAELEAIATEFTLPFDSVRECLDSRHLPKFERLDERDFLILRAVDANAPKDADTAQELTTKIAFFMGENLLITVHRKEHKFFSNLRDKWLQKTPSLHPKAKSYRAIDLIADIILGIGGTYRDPIDQALELLEALEMSVFDVPGGQKLSMRQGYFLKRKGFVFKRMLRLGIESVDGLMALQYKKVPLLQEAKDRFEALSFYNDELSEGVNHLLNLHLAMSSKRLNEASHHTNEVIRFLTIFSIFFMPLNLIAGIYGMNFEFMPELKWPHGYLFALGLMALVTLSIWGWFKKKKWL